MPLASGLHQWSFSARSEASLIKVNFGACPSGDNCVFDCRLVLGGGSSFEIWLRSSEQVKKSIAFSSECCARFVRGVIPFSVPEEVVGVESRCSMLLITFEPSSERDQVHDQPLCHHHQYFNKSVSLQFMR